MRTLARHARSTIRANVTAGLRLVLMGVCLAVFLAGCDLGVPALVSPASAPSAPSTPTQAPADPPSPSAAGDAPTPAPPATSTAVPPAPTPTLAPATPTATPTEPAPEATPTSALVVVNGRTYDAYVPAVSKQHQAYHYSCEFDAAWALLMTYGIDASVDEQIAIIGLDKSIEPYYEETATGIVIHGGDVRDYYSGDYKTNFLARTTGDAMRKVFEHLGLTVTPVHDRPSLEAALRRGELVWIKATADFKPGRPATWVMPDGSSYRTVLGNDHSVVVIGYNSEVVVIRDVLGPTTTNWNRKYEYEIPWAQFLEIWASQSNDGLAVARPGGTSP